MKEYSISTLKYIQTKKTKTVKNCRFESEQIKTPQLQNTQQYNLLYYIMDVQTNE